MVVQRLCGLMLVKRIVKQYLKFNAAIDAVETAASIVPEVSANWSAKVDFGCQSYG